MDFYLQNLPMESNDKVTRRIDLCIECIWAEWRWCPIVRTYGTRSYTIRYELSKFCGNLRKKGFMRQTRFLRPVWIQQIKYECSYFMNATLDGWKLKPNNYTEVIKNMPKIETEIAEANDPEENEFYLIKSAEATTTDVQSFKGLRVGMVNVTPQGKEKLDEDKKPIEATVMLWLRDQAGSKSKIGSFLLAFMNHFKGTELDGEHQNTDNWLNHIIKVISWKDKNREVSVVKLME